MTTAVDLIRRLHQHRQWVNENLFKAAGELSTDQLTREFPIGQGSIWKSLVHLFAAEFVWLEVLQGNAVGVAPGDVPDKIPGNQLGEGRIESLADLRQKWDDLARRWNEYLAKLTDQSLDDLVARRTFRTRRSDVLLHVATHAHYTSAQVINMLRHVGVQKLPEVMHIVLARKELPA